MKLTRRQQDVLDYIGDFIQDNQFAPSVRDIAAHFSLASAGGVHKHLNNLREKGFIAFENNISRSIRIVDTGKSTDIGPPRPVESGLLSLPLMGKVAAGRPIQHFLENETVEYPESMVKNSKETYVLQVQGDSMIEECICDGDYVIVEHREYADNGEMVIAMINHTEATLKKFYRESEKIRLQPANSLMKPIYVDPQEVTIHGIVIGVLRNYR